MDMRYLRTEKHLRKACLHLGGGESGNPLSHRDPVDP